MQVVRSSVPLLGSSGDLRGDPLMKGEESTPEKVEEWVPRLIKRGCTERGASFQPPEREADLKDDGEVELSRIANAGFCKDSR